MHAVLVLSSIGYAAGAEDNPLAQWLANRIEQSVARRGGARRAVLAMRASVSVVAPDRGLSVTLRFDHGQVTVHDGLVGVPDVTVCADFGQLQALAELEVPSLRLLLRWLVPRPDVQRSRWLGVGAAMLDRGVEIYGLPSHPRLVVRLLRLLSVVDGRD